MHWLKYLADVKQHCMLLLSLLKNDNKLKNLFKSYIIFSQQRHQTMQFTIKRIILCNKHYVMRKHNQFTLITLAVGTHFFIVPCELMTSGTGNSQIACRHWKARPTSYCREH